MTNKAIPIVTIDGPSGSGKGTMSMMLARKLGFHYLDSGALYRLLALAASRHKVALDNIEGLAVLAGHMDITFAMKADNGAPQIILEGEDVSTQIRAEEIGLLASKVAAIPEVRAALLQRQHAFAAKPGLIADGRDMGTVVFPSAQVKIFLTAGADERAKRRYKQLIEKGENVNLPALIDSVRERDERDSQRAVSPLVPAPDAHQIDSTDLSIEEVLQLILDLVQPINVEAAAG
ncbi:MAG: (d)CMP kinase [Porticoccaceae bacterium]|nr:(d)CMP kinase [Porticoccaceae bacterium]